MGVNPTKAKIWVWMDSNHRKPLQLSDLQSGAIATLPHTPLSCNLFNINNLWGGRGNSNPQSLEPQSSAFTN